MYELWKGGTFIRIHRVGCVHSEGQREIDPEAEHTMHLEGKYETIELAEAAAQQKANRVKRCSKCCGQASS